MFHPDLHTNINLFDDFVYWICYFWYWALCYVVPLPILYFILKHVSILEDAIGLKKEVKEIPSMLLMINVYSLIIYALYPVLFYIDSNLLTIWQVVSKFNPVLNRILFIRINFMQTFCVVRKFGAHILHKSVGSYTDIDPIAINLSTEGMRKVVNDTTLRLIEDTNVSLTPDSQVMLHEMKRDLMKYTAFEAFMGFLLQVCYSEYVHHQIK